MPYEPKPIDTSSITLPRDLIDLTERLAENAHDIWARQRMADGWNPVQSRRRQETPSVPGAIRGIARVRESLRPQCGYRDDQAILGQGYRIEKS